MTSQSSKPRTAYICRSRQASAMLKKDGLPEGVKCFAVMYSNEGRVFDHVEILFKPTTDGEMAAVLSWFFCLVPTRESFDLMDAFVRDHDSIVHLEMGEIG